MNERLLKTLLWILVGAAVLGIPVVAASRAPAVALIIIAGMLAAEGITWWVIRQGRIQLAATILTGSLWLVMAMGALAAEGLANTPYFLLIVVNVVAGLLLGRRAGFIFAGLTVLTGMLILVLDGNGMLINVIPYRPLSFWLFTSLATFATAGIISLATSGLEQALADARRNEQAQRRANQELQTVRASLEDQIAARTSDLQQRTRYLQASVDVSRATASILDTRRLLQTAVDLIRQQFDLYYAGIFLVDAAAEWAILQAGTGQAGQRMRERGHRIRVGSGMVGWAIANSSPRIALESAADAVRLATPELPETRSEAAIPLQSRGRVLGALSVQSTQPGAFGEVEITTFQALADQLATALDNARLFSESQQALQEARRAYGAASHQAWEDFLRSRDQSQLRFSAGAGPASGAPVDGQALAKDVTVSPADGGQPARSLSLPILVRDQQAGVIHFQDQGNRSAWTEDEISLLQGLVEQMGVAIDSARLYQDTQRLAYREKLIAEVTSRMRETLDLDLVLQTAVKEIQTTLRLPEVLIALAPPEMIGSSQDMTPGEGGEA